MESMKIGITGGTGFIGGYLSRAIEERGDEAIIFSRKSFLPTYLRNRKGISLITAQVPLPSDIEKLDILVNLSGESVMGGRWNEARKEAIRFSRVEYSHELIKNLKNSSKKPLAYLGGSAIGFYGMHETSTPIFSEDSPPGEDFLAKLCVQWEDASLQAESLGIRTCLLRTGIVLSPESGALSQMLTPFKAFVGGPIGSGNQAMSWIHILDTVRAILFLIDSESKGAFNITAPNPKTNEVFSQTVASTLNRPCFMRVPGIAIEALYGEGANVVLKGQNVIPKRLMDLGFSFKFPELKECLEDLLK
jgi:uncharacterized protein (TIGR01777 family)